MLQDKKTPKKTYGLIEAGRGGATGGGEGPGNKWQTPASERDGWRGGKKKWMKGGGGVSRLD